MNTGSWIETYRYHLLLAVTLLVLLLPPFFGTGYLAQVVLLICLNFLFVQSMITVTPHKAKNKFLRYIVVLSLILIAWLEWNEIAGEYITVIKTVLLAIFFCFIIVAIARFIYNSAVINASVLLAAINIYLLIGIISSSIAFSFYFFNPESYNLPVELESPAFYDFIYFTFITMTTVGFGDIVPANQASQTLTYFTAIAGQMYVAIVIAIIVGKMLIQKSVK